MELDLDSTSPARTQIHLVALPHTLLTKNYDWCAYTAKLRRFTYMLVAAGYTPVVYGPDVHDCAEGTVYVPIVTDLDRTRWFGTNEWDVTKVFDQWDAAAPHWHEMNVRAGAHIADRWQPADILGLIGGTCQQQVVTELAGRGIKPIVWEWGIGYSGVIPGSHRTFESYAWAHHVAGLQHADDIRFFDSVVPNCYDLADFTPNVGQAGEYLLFMGRPTPRKGLSIIAEIAQRTDLPLKVAGQPGADIPGAEHVGIVTGMEKAELLAGARALLCPTTYLEPFGGVAVEAMLSGTPVIATDWGAFTETVQHGINGFRCRTLSDFVTAVEHSHLINRHLVHAHAAMRYTLEQGTGMYAQVIENLQTLNSDGWYHLP